MCFSRSTSCLTSWRARMGWIRQVWKLYVIGIFLVAIALCKSKTITTHLVFHTHLLSVLLMRIACYNVRASSQWSHLSTILIQQGFYSRGMLNIGTPSRAIGGIMWMGILPATFVLRFVIIRMWCMDLSKSIFVWRYSSHENGTLFYWDKRCHKVSNRRSRYSKVVLFTWKGSCLKLLTRSKNIVFSVALKQKQRTKSSSLKCNRFLKYSNLWIVCVHITKVSFCLNLLPTHPC